MLVIGTLAVKIFSLLDNYPTTHFAISHYPSFVFSLQLKRHCGTAAKISTC